MVRAKNLSLAGAALAAVILPQAAAAKGTKVTVDGQVYRVVVKGDDVYVFNKATYVRFAPSETERRRRAAVLATGCDVINMEQMGASYAGLLKCNPETK